MYIIASSLISHQETFRNKGYSSHINAKSRSDVLVHPDYKDWIPVIKRRRMSDAIKMSITCTLDCMEQIAIDELDGIIIGISMGSSMHTKNFLNKIHGSNDFVISPSSFITSTHNTIAGQISLFLKNNNYNNTHTHNSLSFEHALMDMSLLLNEGCENVLVGGVDESENELFELGKYLGINDYPRGAGAGLFVCSSESNGLNSIKLRDINCICFIEDISKGIISFLDKNNFRPNDIDVVLYSSISIDAETIINSLFSTEKCLDYLSLAGYYFTSSSFALGFGKDLIENKKARNVLICNNMNPSNLGLILLESE